MYQYLSNANPCSFGAGKWNGFGGKVEINETHEAAARRELLEEAHVKAEHIEKRGLLLFTFDNEPGLHLEVHVYATENISGTPEESEEMAPKWFGINEIPYEVRFDAMLLEMIWMCQFWFCLVAYN